MLKTLFLFTIFLSLISPLNYDKNSRKIAKTRIELTKEKQGTFSKKQNAYLYQSFVLGNKTGLSRKIKDKLKTMGLYHLMTPSGLHYSCLFFFIAVLRRKYKNRYLAYAEIGVGLLIHTFLPGFYAFKRVALLNALKVTNTIFLENKLSRLEVLFSFLIYDIFFGTFRYSKISFFMSILFIGIFYLRGMSKFYIIFYLFIGQVMMAYLFGNEVSVMNLILSPLYTMLFSLIYPFLCVNIFFLHIFNYSDLIITFLAKLLTLFYQISSLTPYFKVSLITLICAMLINRKNFLFFISISCLSLFTS